MWTLQSAKLGTYLIVHRPLHNEVQILTMADQRQVDEYMRALPNGGAAQVYLAYELKESK